MTRGAINMRAIGYRRLSAAVLFVAVALLAATSLVAAQQPWPTKPIRIIAPVPPGSTNDLLARIVADKLSGMLGQSVIVENREAGNTLIGTRYVAQQPPDGYTLLITQSTLTTAPALLKNVEYDAAADFEPISLLARTPLAIFVN